jgi:hypothetical protein
MDEQKKSFIREVVDVLEAAGFEVTSFEGADCQFEKSAYKVMCDWAKVTVRRLPPNLPETAGKPEQ